jgi:hypothetical protein
MVEGNPILKKKDQEVPCPGKRRAIFIVRKAPEWQVEMPSGIYSKKFSNYRSMAWVLPLRGSG